ncbi:MAG TPA: DUF1656 domain-containing protein [Geminicoccus sp.]|uniref:DUF1656 domain-containing protein n=1 Tax=Geminicoccus sp. TaxID=2024832 RepID=UPI002C4F9C93|nr:DUF1656 domain-containing protein [Geminicoccus sp.]HWL69699.1 DUF1656 domain-containing protein [Geminicoccus sp.]
MNHAFHELVVGGVLVAPIVSYAVSALVLVLLLRPVLHLIGFSNYFSRPPVAELSLYVVVFGLLTLIY